MTTPAHTHIMKEIHNTQPAIAYALQWTEETLHAHIESIASALATRHLAATNHLQEDTKNLQLTLETALAVLKDQVHSRIDAATETIADHAIATYDEHVRSLNQLEATVALLSTELEQLKQRQPDHQADRCSRDLAGLANTTTARFESVVQRLNQTIRALAKVTDQAPGELSTD